MADQCRGNAGEAGAARDKWVEGMLDWAARLGGSTLTPAEAAGELPFTDHRALVGITTGGSDNAQ